MGKKMTPYTEPTSQNQDERIAHYLTQLGLLGMLPYYKRFSEESLKSNGTPKDYLEALAKRETEYKKNSRIKSLVLQAGLGKFSTLEELKMLATKSNVKTNTNWRLMFELAKCSFLSEHKNIIFLGQAGVGKTTLAKAIGKKAIDLDFTLKFIELDKLIDNMLFRYKDVDTQKRFFNTLIRPDLLILDEVKNRETNPTIQDFLYRLVHSRHQEKSTIFTSNKDLAEWEKLFGDYSEAAIDRITDKKFKIIINIKGGSYRADSRGQLK